MEEREKDKKSKESKTVHEKKERTYEKRSVLLKRTSSKVEEGGSKQKSKSPSDKKGAKSGSVALQNLTIPKLESKEKHSESEPKPSTNTSPPPESRCSKCGQKVAKRRATS